MITVFVPPGEGSYFEHVAVVNGNSVRKTFGPGRTHNGRMVVDLPRAFFVQNVLLGPQGLKWHTENPEALAFIGSIPDPAYDVGDVFPGKDRPAPIAPAATLPVMVKLVAPEGVTSYSHGGIEHKLDKTGTVTVRADLADILRAHGFKDAA